MDDALGLLHTMLLCLRFHVFVFLCFHVFLETKVSTNENGEIISQVVGFSEGCDQNGDRVSKKN